jgi:nitroreductase
MKKISLLAIVALSLWSCAIAQDVQLPAPRTTGGKPLMEALAARHTSREFSAKELDAQTISNMLWAAYGFNRSDKRTAPSAMNKQEYNVYVFMASGTYLYDAKENVLKLLIAKDLRKLTGKQDFVENVPLNLVFAYDKNIMESQNMAYLDCGYISQNVYLFCASEGLNSVARGYFDAAQLSNAMGLPENIVPVLTQSVGYSK